MTKTEIKPPVWINDLKNIEKPSRRWELKFNSQVEKVEDFQRFYHSFVAIFLRHQKNNFLNDVAKLHLNYKQASQDDWLACKANIDSELKLNWEACGNAIIHNKKQKVLKFASVTATDYPGFLTSHEDFMLEGVIADVCSNSELKAIMKRVFISAHPGSDSEYWEGYESEEKYWAAQ